MNNGLTGSAVSVVLHGGIILLFSWFTLHPGAKRPVVIDLSLLEDEPRQCRPQPAPPQPVSPPLPRPEPRVVEPRPLAKTPPVPSPPRPDEPQVQKVAASENLVPVAAPKVEAAPSLPPSASAVPAAPARSAGAVAAASPRGEESDASPEKVRRRYLKEHFTYIRESIMRKLEYPAVARRMGWTGTVKVSFCVCENGTVMDVQVVDSSGYGILDNNVVETIKRASPFPRPPVMAQVVMPITYRLN